jgi:hypothetical protein
MGLPCRLSEERKATDKKSMSREESHPIETTEQLQTVVQGPLSAVPLLPMAEWLQTAGQGKRPVVQLVQRLAVVVEIGAWIPQSGVELIQTL